MSSAWLFVALLAQSQFPDAFPRSNPRAAAALQQLVSLAEPSDNESAKKAAAYQEYRFVTSFNHLKKALDEFAGAYNQGKLDVKKIEEIKKAWRDLENNEVRFRLEKKQIAPRSLALAGTGTAPAAA